VVREADLAGRRVLDVGCGTGRWSAALAERGSRVWGVDPSAEMVSQARERGVNAKLGPAEKLPFKEGWFERALLALVIHVFDDRRPAFRELSRVLALDGRAGIVTFSHRHFDRYYLAPYFPSLARIDLERFPPADELTAELAGAGFEARWVELVQKETLFRERVIERIRGRFISTLQLLDDAEFVEGLARAERELPECVDTELHWLVGDAVRAPL